MIRVAVCDDDKEIRAEIPEKLTEFFHKRGGDGASIVTFANATELIGSPDAGGFDIFFLDVLMPGMDGIELGKRLRADGVDGAIIYLTSSSEYAVSSYDVGALHYLIKPVSDDKLEEVLSRACETLELRRSQGVVVRTRDGETFIPYAKLMYSELQNRAVMYYMSDGGIIRGVTMRVSFPVAVEQLLKDERFVLCGASWCVNIAAISAVERKSVTFSNGTVLQMPPRAVDTLRTRWLDFWLEK